MLLVAFWLSRSGSTAPRLVPSRLLHPQIPPQRHCREEDIPQLLPRTSHFHEMPEMQEISGKCGHNTLKSCNSYKVAENVLGFFSQIIGFLDFLLFHFFMPNFPLQEAVQGLGLLQRADNKSSLTQEKTKPSQRILWVNAETCWRVLWGKEGSGESWQLFLAIHFPFQKANKRQLPGRNRLRAANPREAKKS